MCFSTQVMLLPTVREEKGRQKAKEEGREEESANKLSSRSIRNDVSIGPGQTGNKFLRRPNRSTWICSALINRNPENEAVENRATVSGMLIGPRRYNLVGLKELHLKQLHADTVTIFYNRYKRNKN